MRWRPALFALHRDVGYVSVGLTLAYAVSGVAVNHRHDWNYNQTKETVVADIGTPAELLADGGFARPGEAGGVHDASAGAGSAELEDRALVAAVGRALGRAGPPRNAFWRSPDRLSLFYGPGGTDTVDYQPSTGTAEHTVLRDRAVLRDLNFLHLNESRGAWTYLADAFAVALAFLAFSGAIMVRGSRGLAGRGGALLALGLALPVLVLVLLRWL